jgi:aspartate 1-decarboxylase
MFRTFVSGKIHQLKVTGLQPRYSGSCLICPELLAAAGIEAFEKVEIYSLTSTARIATYVFPGAAQGEFTLNGGAALHFRLGDQVAVVAYRQEERFSGANCVIVNPLDNSIEQMLRYTPPDQSVTSITAKRYGQTTVGYSRALAANDCDRPEPRRSNPPTITED